MVVGIKSKKWQIKKGGQGKVFEWHVVEKFQNQCFGSTALRVTWRPELQGFDTISFNGTGPQICSLSPPHIQLWGQSTILLQHDSGYLVLLHQWAKNRSPQITTTSDPRQCTKLASGKGHWADTPPRAVFYYSSYHHSYHFSYYGYCCYCCISFYYY